MSVLQANCPSCAAPIEFVQGSTLVVICKFCRSAVARTDRKLEDLGKVAEIVQTQSPLRVGLQGLWSNVRFELTGRTQLAHEAGGVWDEWYATFSNGWVGWLAEAQGKFYLTFYQPLPQGTEVPNFENLEVGQQFPIKLGKAFLVAEKGTATSLTAEGEIPYQFTPNERSKFADLSGANRAFATVDYSLNPPYIFVGNEVTLADIGLADAKPAEREARKVSAVGMGCPNCGGPLELKLPDQSMRVACPNCDSLLDVNQGNLTWLKSLTKVAEAPPFDLKVGMTGNFADGKQMPIIGATVRSVTFDGIKYFWHEYLLYTASIGFRWIVASDNHWNFIEPVNLADVTDSGTKVSYNGKNYKIFQDAPATVEYVAGEFYWRVEQGETVQASDFVNAPLMLSREISATQSGQEINWSSGKYLQPEEVEKAFGVQNLPRPWNVAPNQPFLYASLYKIGFAMLGVLMLVGMISFCVGLSSPTVLTKDFVLPPMANATTGSSQFSEPFDLQARKNVEISVIAPNVDNSWVSVDADLVNENNEEMESVELPVEYYQGVEDGESWSEGDKEKSETVSALPGGKYTLRVEGTWEKWQQPMNVTVKVSQNKTRGMNFCCAFVVLLLLPLIALIWSFIFESRRWSESQFGGSSGSSSDDSSDTSSCSSCSSD